MATRVEFLSKMEVCVRLWSFSVRWRCVCAVVEYRGGTHTSDTEMSSVLM